MIIKILSVIDRHMPDVHVYAMRSAVHYKGKGGLSSIMVNPMLKPHQIVCSNPVEVS